ncbi:MAG: hypothetical protein ACRDYC_07840, partial [Acidimicrobiales bacterium]
GVEANARLTSVTGLVLVVMLAVEGLTIVSIRPLLSWHIAIGLALVPPVGVKMGSTLWRFGRYYLHNPAYRRAGPPHPVLRVLGPLVMVSTVVVLVSGVALWLAGPDSGLLLSLHLDSFIVWFALMTVHVLGHIVKATRLTGADLTSRRRGAGVVPFRGARYGLLLASLAAGVVVAVATRGMVGSWAAFGGHGG